jgi:hypothetical protein
MFDSDIFVIQRGLPARHGSAITELSMLRAILIIATNWLEKRPGEPTLIDLEMRDGNVVVASVR